VNEAIAFALGAVAMLAAGLLTFRTARRGTDHSRIKSLEDRVDSLERRNQALWRYNRQLIDHVYRGYGPPPPPPPEAMAA